MANAVNQAENTPQSSDGDLNQPQETGFTVREEMAELESRLARKDEELARAGASVTELEQVIAGKDGEITTLNQSRAELEEKLVTTRHSLAEAVASYKTTVLQANPEVIEELISGDTVESINESLGKAKTLVNKVRQGVEAGILLAKVPAGAPERTAPDLSALSAREKIQYAIAGQTR